MAFADSFVPLYHLYMAGGFASAEHDKLKEEFAKTSFGPTMFGSSGGST